MLVTKHPQQGEYQRLLEATGIVSFFKLNDEIREEEFLKAICLNDNKNTAIVFDDVSKCN